MPRSLHEPARWRASGFRRILATHQVVGLSMDEGSACALDPYRLLARNATLSATGPDQSSYRPSLRSLGPSAAGGFTKAHHAIFPPIRGGAKVNGRAVLNVPRRGRKSQTRFIPPVSVFNHMLKTA